MTTKFKMADKSKMANKMAAMAAKSKMASKFKMAAKSKMAVDLAMETLCLCNLRHFYSRSYPFKNNKIRRSELTDHLNRAVQCLGSKTNQLQCIYPACKSKTTNSKVTAQHGIKKQAITSDPV